MSSSSHRGGVTAFAVTLLFTVPLKVAPGDSYKDLADGLVAAFLVRLAEPIIPDVRWEFGGSRAETGTDLPLPIPLNFGTYALPIDGVLVALNLPAEPHCQVTDEVYRWVFAG